MNPTNGSVYIMTRARGISNHITDDLAECPHLATLVKIALAILWLARIQMRCIHMHGQVSKSGFGQASRSFSLDGVMTRGVYAHLVLGSVEDS